MPEKRFNDNLNENDNFFINNWGIVFLNTNDH